MMEEKPVATVGHVDARIRGRKIRFCLPREPRTFRMLEEACGPISGLVQRIIGGRYTTTDVRTILATAHPFVPAAAVPVAYMRVAAMTQIMRGEPDPEPPVNGAPLARIDALLAHVPFDGWVTLAALIIAAAVNGLRADKAFLDLDPPGERQRENAA